MTKKTFEEVIEPGCGFDQALGGNFIEPAILANTGIVGDQGELFMLDRDSSSKFKGYEEKRDVLLLFGKECGRFVSWQDVLANPDFDQADQIMILPKWNNPLLWKGTVHFCKPNKQLEM